MTENYPTVQQAKQRSRFRRATRPLKTAASYIGKGTKKAALFIGEGVLTAAGAVKKTVESPGFQKGIKGVSRHMQSIAESDRPTKKVVGVKPKYVYKKAGKGKYKRVLVKSASKAVSTPKTPPFRDESYNRRLLYGGR